MITLKVNDPSAPPSVTEHDGHRMHFVGWNGVGDYGVLSAEVGCLDCEEGPFDAFLEELIITPEG